MIGPLRGPSRGTPRRQSADQIKRGMAQEDAITAPIPTLRWPQKSIDDNRVWIGAWTRLIAGVGRADVRAGAMKLLATVTRCVSARRPATRSPDRHRLPGRL